MKPYSDFCVAKIGIIGKPKLFINIYIPFVKAEGLFGKNEERKYKTHVNSNTKG